MLRGCPRLGGCESEGEVKKLKIALVVATMMVPLLQASPAYAGCRGKGGTEMATVPGEGADRNGDGFVCVYEQKNGNIRVRDNDGSPGQL